MLQSVSLGGKKRPIVFGNWVFRKIKVEKGITPGQIVESLQQADTTVLPDVVFYGLQAGELATSVQSPDTYTADDVALWMDLAPAGIKIYVDMLVQAITGEAPQNGEEGEKKKGAAIGTTTE